MAAASHASAGKEGTAADCRRHADPYDQAKSAVRIGSIVAVGGAALLGTGLLLDGRTGLVPGWSGGPTLRLVVAGGAP